MIPAPKQEELTGFDFDDGGRTYSCSIEPLLAGRPEMWWWFRVSASRSRGPLLSRRERQWLPDDPANRPAFSSEAEDGHRYAPFRVSATDTRRSVQTAIVAYYDDLLARRGQSASYSRGNYPPR